MMLDTVKIRKDFPILQRRIHGKPLVYLDNAATTQKPKQVIDTLVNFYSKHNANVHRGIHTLAEEATQMYEESREKIAKFIGASSTKEIIFVRNATEAINLVAYSWGRKFLKRGDEIILSEAEHHSNIVPWQILKTEKGITLRFIPLTNQGYFDLQRFTKMLSKKTKLVSLAHVSNVLGTINPVSQIGKLAHENKALFLIDGSQSVPRMPTDVSLLNCDFLAISGHKMLGPTGIGVLYAKEDLLEAMPPFLGGGDMISEVYFDHAKWNDIPYKFEAGTPNVADAIALGAAVDYLNHLGMKNIYEHELQLTKYALEKFLAIKKIKVYGSHSMKDKIGVISFTISGIHPHDVAQILDREGIAIRSGFHCAMPLHLKLNIPATCRVSFYIYNTKEDIDKLVEAIYITLKMFNG